MPIKTKSSVIVKSQPSTMRRAWFWGIASVSVVALLWAAFQYGLSRAGFFGAVAANEQAELRARIANLESRNDELKHALARAERQLQIDHTAYQGLDDALQQSTQDIASLRAELNFYRNIISPPNSQRGAQIQELTLESTGTADSYRYRLVLIQALDHKRLVSGRATLEIAGHQEGEAITVRGPEVIEGSGELKFRYFQNLHGVIRLPAGFQPERVRVTVSTNDKKAPKIERWYAWSTILRAPPVAADTPSPQGDDLSSARFKK